jgi:osmotically-inducible protein OsmY
MTETQSTEAERIEGFLHRRLNGRIRDLHVVVREQDIILQGHTDTYYAKQLAQHAAAEVSGLPILANEIEVR